MLHLGDLLLLLLLGLLLHGIERRAAAHHAHRALAALRLLTEQRVQVLVALVLPLHLPFERVVLLRQISDATATTQLPIYLIVGQRH